MRRPDFLLWDFTLLWGWLCIFAQGKILASKDVTCVWNYGYIDMHVKRSTSKIMNRHACLQTSEMMGRHACIHYRPPFTFKHFDTVYIQVSSWLLLYIAVWSTDHKQCVWIKVPIKENMKTLFIISITQI